MQSTLTTFTLGTHGKKTDVKQFLSNERLDFHSFKKNSKLFYEI